jgi:hypothetical protein
VSTGARNDSYPETPSDIPDELRDRPARLPVEEDAPSPMQIEIFRRMTPGRRLEIAEQLYWGARAMKAAWLRSLNPAWTEEQVEAEVKRIFSNARS